MPMLTYAGYYSGPNLKAYLGETYSALITEGSVVASDDDQAIVGTGSFHFVHVQGTVASADTTIALGDDIYNDQGEYVRIDSTGLVASYAVGNPAILIDATNSTIENHGWIYNWSSSYQIYLNGGGIGVWFRGAGSGQSNLVNTGLIEASLRAVEHYGTETLVTTNSGTIKSAQWSYIDLLPAAYSAIDRIFNSGTMIGDIWLAGGDDLYDGTNGHLSGKVFGDNGADTIKGGVDDDWFHGGAGNDSLNGGLGADVLTGAAGDDTFFVDNPADQALENVGEGTDTVFASATYALLAVQEIEFLRAESAVSTVELDLTGNEVANTLVGNDGANVLDGAGAADVLQGLGGDDTYVLGSEATGVDTVIDTGGIDMVTSAITRSLVAFSGIENLTLTGVAVADASGDGAANVLTGNAAANTLDGGPGNDTLLGLDGIDILIGGTGRDTMAGGAGNDIFRFATTSQSAAGAGADVITDFDDAGDDRIDLDAVYGGTLTYIHNAAFTAPGQVRINDIAGTGVIVEVNTAGASAPEMQILLTATTLAAMSASDFTGVSAMIAPANSRANVIVGNAAANRLDGMAGNDTLFGLGGGDMLIGGAGRDIMTGGSGNDVFRFAATSQSPVGAGADVITDFDDFGDDRIDLTAVYGGTLKYIGNHAFSAGGQVRINDIAGPDVIVEVNTAGASGAETQIRLTATTLASMTANDFFL